MNFREKVNITKNAYTFKQCFYKKRLLFLKNKRIPYNIIYVFKPQAREGKYNDFYNKHIFLNKCV